MPAHRILQVVSRSTSCLPQRWERAVRTDDEILGDQISLSDSDDVRRSANQNRTRIRRADQLTRSNLNVNAPRYQCQGNRRACRHRVRHASGLTDEAAVRVVSMMVLNGIVVRIIAAHRDARSRIGLFSTPVECWRTSVCKTVAPHGDLPSEVGRQQRVLRESTRQSHGFAPTVSVILSWQPRVQLSGREG